MKIWKIILAVLTIIVGILLFAESEDVSRMGQLANALGANVSALTLYAGYIVSILYIVISILLFVYINKKDKQEDIIIIILSLAAFVFSFAGPKRFEDLPFLSFCAVLCLITAIISYIINKRSKNGLAEIIKQCPQCGARIEDDSRFCSECGKEITQANVCPHCGARVYDGDVYCENCGRNLADGSYASTNNISDKIQEDGDSPYKKYLFYILCAIALIALIGGGWYGYKEYSAYTEKKIAREKFVADSLEQVRKELVDSPKFDSQKSNEAVKEKQIETISDDANSKMHNFGLHSKHHHLTGTFEDSSGIYPIELDFNSSGRDVSDVIYKNVKLGGKIRMTCTYFDYSSITVKGKDGKNDFSISLDCTSRNSFRGTAIDGEKEFVVVMEANCQHE